MPFLFFAAALVVVVALTRKPRAAEPPPPAPPPQIKPTPVTGIPSSIPGGPGYGTPPSTVAEGIKFVARPSGMPASYFIHSPDNAFVGVIGAVDMVGAAPPGAPTNAIGLGAVASITSNIGNTDSLGIAVGTPVYILGTEVPAFGI